MKSVLVCLFFANCMFASFWIEGEYLLWSIKKNPLSVPLLTSASEDDALPGAIGQPGTHVLLGQDHFHMGWLNGFRVGAGVKNWIEGNYFLLPTAAEKRSFSTSGQPGSPNFAVPIFDVTGVCGLNGAPGETIFILPGALFGGPGFFGKFDFRIASRVQGAELNGLWGLLLGGFRWFQLHEALTFKAQTHTVENVPFPAGFFNFSDRFITSNDFLAAQVGLAGQFERKKWKVGGALKGDLGAVLQQVKIKGSSQTSGGNLFFETAGTAGETLPGGIFAEPTHSGNHRKNCFAYAFEAHFSAGYKLIRHLEIHLGYTFFWLSRVLRPGKEIDRKINTTLTALADASRSTVGTGPGPIPFGSSGGAPSPRGPKKPSVLFHSNSFYAQGLDIGLSLIF